MTFQDLAVADMATILTRSFQTLRKCNKAYYPAVFYELGHYCHQADACGYALPYKLAKVRQAREDRPAQTSSKTPSHS